MKNLCATEEVRIAIAESSSCSSFIAKLLETGREEEQWHVSETLKSLVYYFLFLQRLLAVLSLTLSPMASSRWAT
jgi:hypothetical protein